MKKLEPWEIIEMNCKPYGGFVNVITKCGGTLVSQLWIKSMEDYLKQEKGEQIRCCGRCDGINDECILNKTT